MALVRKDWFEFPDVFRRFFDAEMEPSFVRVEEFLDGETLVLRAELPGVDPDKEVELTVENDILYLRAERQEKTEHKEKDGYRSEFRYGSFARSIPLPTGSTAEDIAASYKDGVLEIRIPIPEQPKVATTKVAITRS